MKEIRFTLLTDGSGDRVLIPAIAWLLHQKLPRTPARIEWADFSRLRRPPNGLAGRIFAAVDYYPCDVLLVHRDAEREPREHRTTEIHDAILEAKVQLPFVCVIPVRMQEAWLLIEETAIRRAAGNPRGKAAIALPKLKNLEDLPDPKNILYSLLRAASELHGRRLKLFPTAPSAFRVAQLIEDWAPLRKLPAFIAFESEVDQVLRGMGRQPLPHDSP